MGRKINFFSYLRVDCVRVFSSWRFLVGIIGVCAVMYLASYEGIDTSTNVVYVVWLIVYGMPFMISLVFSAFPFSCCFCEDVEQKYAYWQVARGNLTSYAISKIIVVFLSAAITTMMGMLLYVSILRFQIPWIEENDAICQSALTLGGFRSILQSGMYYLYFALFGLQFGMLSGLLSVLAAAVSLFINNRLLTLSVPFMGFYLLSYYGGALIDYDKFNLISIYNATYNLWSNDLISFLYAIGFSVFGLLMMGGLIVWKLNRRMQTE